MGSELIINKATGEIAEISITPDQIDLIKRTIAKGATDDELQLYFYDCRRRGVHPLDKLIHFTKRGDGGDSRYTPIIGIDYMRSRASETGEYAGSEDPTFQGEPISMGFKASCTVHRFVQGQKCAFTASARWPEYYPGDGGKGFMWRKMPYTMLGKCAEALALRKAFPQQLSGLYTNEEMDQAGSAPHLEKEINPPKEEKRAASTDQAKFLSSMADMRAKLGDSEFFLILGRHGVEGPEEISDRKKQIEVFKEMTAKLPKGVA